jgi:hypothetical protein
LPPEQLDERRADVAAPEETDPHDAAEICAAIESHAVRLGSRRRSITMIRPMSRPTRTFGAQPFWVRFVSESETIRAQKPE